MARAGENEEQMRSKGEQCVEKLLTCDNAVVVWRPNKEAATSSFPI